VSQLQLKLLVANCEECAR